MLTILFAACLVLLAALPAWLTFRNLPLFQPLAPLLESDRAPAVSVLIPARNEAAGIEEAITRVLESRGVRIELLIMDDHSADQTASLVAQRASEDSRVWLLLAPELPDGWNGKQHACWHLAQAAQFEFLLFVDADVRLATDAIARLVASLQESAVSLLSGFPHQETETWLEKLLIPMMHFVLLGYLPLDQMRANTQPGFGAGCGQLFLARRQDYFDSGGHRGIRSSRHDGLKLPRAFRAAGFKTDVCNAEDIARVRMYASAAAVVQGLLKNATEGIANNRLIGLFTVLLAGGSVLPILSLPHAIQHGWNSIAVALLALATLLSFLPRALIALRLGQSWLGVMLQPLAVAVFLGIQWWAFLRAKLGREAVAWRGRSA